MNTVWSTYIQNINTLYLSRALRFSDLFRDKYVDAFRIDDKRRILEIGCGPGALAQALDRWYPEAEVVGIDRDTNFIEFAKREAPHISFLEGDATALSFPDESFDVTVSNTVAEHVEPAKFFGEQYRVLKKDGVCLMLSARRGINHTAPCVSAMSDLEKDVWQRVQSRCAEVDKKYKVCAYPMSEMEYPRIMESYGFRQVSVEYITVNLTPDDPRYSVETAHAMINAKRYGDLDGVDYLSHIAADLVTDEERIEMKRAINARYDERINLYNQGIKQWDTNVSVTMILRGIK